MSEIELQTPEGFISQETKDDITLPDCLPAHYNLTEFDNTPENLRHTLRKYYASELLNITESTMPPLEFFSKSVSDYNDTYSKIGVEYTSLITRLIKTKDVCDRQGILFVSKLFELPEDRISEDVKKVVAAVKREGDKWGNELVKFALAISKKDN